MMSFQLWCVLIGLVACAMAFGFATCSYIHRRYLSPTASSVDIYLMGVAVLCLFITFIVGLHGIIP